MTNKEIELLKGELRILDLADGEADNLCGRCLRAIEQLEEDVSHWELMYEECR